MRAADVNDSAAREAITRWGWESFSADWRDVTRAGDVDVVVIVTPNDSHADIAIDAFRHGKHVLCEKPLANTVDNAKPPLTMRIKSNSGISPTMWEIPRPAETWRFNPEECGGGPLVFDDGHHKFALAWHFMGIADEVHAWIGETEREPGFVLDAPAIVSWKFPGNRYGSLEVVYSPELVLDTQHYAQDDRIEITGTKGVIWVTRGHGKTPISKASRQA